MSADRRTARLAADLAAADVIRADPGSSRADLVEAAVTAALRVMADEVRKVHKHYGGDPLAVDDECDHDGHDWPCVTVRILDEFTGGAS